MSAPQLFDAVSVIDNFPHRGTYYDRVKVAWLVTERDYDPGYDYTKLLGPLAPHLASSWRGEELHEKSKACVDEYLTRSEADQLAHYLKERRDTAVDITEVSIPFDKPYGVLPMVDFPGIPESSVVAIDFFKMCFEDGYDLPFKVWGFYAIWKDHPLNRGVHEPTPLTGGAR